MLTSPHLPCDRNRRGYPSLIPTLITAILVFLLGCNAAIFAVHQIIGFSSGNSNSAEPKVMLPRRRANLTLGLDREIPASERSSGSAGRSILSKPELQSRLTSLLAPQWTEIGGSL